MRRTTIRCPWCRQGTVVLHGSDEEWIVRLDERTIGQPTYAVAPPVEWVSCTSCVCTATQDYLIFLLSGNLRRYPNRLSIERSAASV